jgi:hypothetical protein
MLLDPTLAMFDYPHPALEPLRDAIRRAWAGFGTYAAGERQAELLAQAGFVDIASESQNYVLGGSSTEGRIKYSIMVQLIRSMRASLVDKARTISAIDFDSHFSALRTGNDPAVEGTYFYRLAMARKQ